jgi:hypothetical protein
VHCCARACCWQVSLLGQVWQACSPPPLPAPGLGTLQELQVLLDYKGDESYTPQKLVVRAGTCHQDVKVGLWVLAPAAPAATLLPPPPQTQAACHRLPEASHMPLN